VLGLGGGVGWLVYQEHQSTIAAPYVPPPKAVAAEPAVEALEPVAAARPLRTDSAAALEEVARQAAPLNGERWLTATLDGLLELHPELKLSSEEVAQLKEIYAYCQQVRTTFEADIAELVAMGETRAQIRIPPYPQAGARLEALWVEEVSAELGENRFDEIDARLGETFEVAFKGFGTSVQLLDVELRRDPQEGLMYRIVARMDYFDPTETGGLSSTPLITVAASYDLRPETVATGEWRPLARHFPRLPH
jgi:hypothetical protein